MIRALLIDDDRDHALNIEEELNQRKVITNCVASISEAIGVLKRRAALFDLVILSIADRSQPWVETLHDLQQAAWQSGIGARPFFFCISRFHFDHEFQLQIERLGARLAFEE